MKRTQWTVLGLVLIASLVLAGCGNKPTAEEIVAKMEETVENTVDAHGIVTAYVNAQGIEMSATAEVWEKAPDLVRAEVLEASQPDLVGTLLVKDAQQGWFYEPAKNRVSTGEVESLDTPLPEEMISEMRHVIQAVLDISNVELSGEEAVAGREAYKLTLTPKEDVGQELFPGGGTATLWVDKEQWIPLKAIYEGGMFGQGTVEVLSFELNPGLSDDLFAFTPPEGAEVVRHEKQEAVSLTLDEARALAGFPLLVPEYVPGDATLIEVVQVDSAFGLVYDHSPQVSFSIIQGTELIRPLPAGSAQNITVRGQAGTAITDETIGATFLYWTDGEIVFSLAGRISLDEALKVAESLR